MKPYENKTALLKSLVNTVMDPPLVALTVNSTHVIADIKAMNDRTEKNCEPKWLSWGVILYIGPLLEGRVIFHRIPA